MMSALVKTEATIDGCDAESAEDAFCWGDTVNVKDAVAMEEGVMIILMASNLVEDYLLAAVGLFVSCFWSIFWLCCPYVLVEDRLS